jgi:hypothetical protein
MSKTTKDFLFADSSKESTFELIYGKKADSTQEAFDVEQSLFGLFATLYKIQERLLKADAETEAKK